jgi:hypothetical protein
MALFGFSDISFNKGASQRTGPLAPLVDSQFKQNTYRYPIDLGNADKAHYMVIYIRQQKATQFSGTTVSDTALDKASVAQQEGAKAQIFGAIDAANQGKLGSHFAAPILGKINAGLGQINSATGGALSGITSAIGKAAGGVVGSIDNLFGTTNITFGGSSAQTKAMIDTSIKKITNKSFLQTTQLTTDAIALYMPDTLNYSYQQSYDQLNLGGEVLGQVAAAAKSAADEYKNEGGSAAAGSLAKSAGLAAGNKLSQVVGKLTGSQEAARVGFTAVTGKVQNPMLEMIYKSPNFRTFQFDFTFYPRDEKEALEAQRIIERLRFHQAPELIEDAQGFLVPPSEFDIKFYYAGAQNPNIPPISTCVLTAIDVNYAPNGFTAYEVPGENRPALGRTGMPVAIQVTLQFQETTYLTKADFRNDRGNQTLGKV